jgi:hypothetical protein
MHAQHTHTSPTRMHAPHTRTHTHTAPGFGTAKHLSEQGYNVTLLEASPNPGGLATGWRTAQGKEVEAGK